MVQNLGRENQGSTTEVNETSDYGRLGLSEWLIMPIIMYLCYHTKTLFQCVWKMDWRCDWEQKCLTDMKNFACSAWSKILCDSKCSCQPVMLKVTILGDDFVEYFLGNNNFFFGNNLHLLLKKNTAEAIICLHP